MFLRTIFLFKLIFTVCLITILNLRLKSNSICQSQSLYPVTISSFSCSIFAVFFSGHKLLDDISCCKRLEICSCLYKWWDNQIQIQIQTAREERQHCLLTEHQKSDIHPFKPCPLMKKSPTITNHTSNSQRNQNKMWTCTHECLCWFQFKHLECSDETQCSDEKKCSVGNCELVVSCSCYFC